MNINIAVALKAPNGYPAIFKTELNGSIKKAYELGYSGIEWHLREPDQKETEDIGKLCGGLNMKVSCIGTGMACAFDGLTLMHDDSEIRMRAVERLKTFIDMGAFLNSKVIIGSMKGKIPDDNVQEKYMGYLTDNLNKTLEYAESRNVVLLMEALNRYETNILNTAEQMDEFVKNMGSKLLKTHIDIFHMNIEEQDICKSIEKCAETLGNVHLADSNRRHPGAGHIDFEQVFRTLKRIGYTGPIGVECLPFPEPELAAKNAIKYLNSISY